MEFKFNINEIFKEPIIEINQNLIPPGFKGDRRALWDTVMKVSEIINAMGEASAAAQGLTKTITSAERLRNSENQKLYFLVDQKANSGKGAVTGMLKVGRKGLYLFDNDGRYYQVSPPCVLDFYVHESRQRNGLGKQLFEHMLQNEQVPPLKMALDRPSDNFLNFLNKYYSLNRPIKQMNNYVVFDGFFPENQEEHETDGRKSATLDKSFSANGLQSSPAYGRYGPPRPPSCSMGQIIHNQTSAINSNSPVGVQSLVATKCENPYSSLAPEQVRSTQSAPNYFENTMLAQNNRNFTGPNYNSGTSNNQTGEQYQYTYGNNAEAYKQQNMTPRMISQYQSIPKLQQANTENMMQYNQAVSNQSNYQQTINPQMNQQCVPQSQHVLEDSNIAIRQSRFPAATVPQMTGYPQENMDPYQTTYSQNLAPYNSDGVIVNTKVASNNDQTVMNLSAGDPYAQSFPLQQPTQYHMGYQITQHVPNVTALRDQQNQIVHSNVGQRGYQSNFQVPQNPNISQIPDNAFENRPVSQMQIYNDPVSQSPQPWNVSRERQNQNLSAPLATATPEQVADIPGYQTNDHLATQTVQRTITDVQMQQVPRVIQSNIPNQHTLQNVTISQMNQSQISPLSRSLEAMRLLPQPSQHQVSNMGIQKAQQSIPQICQDEFSNQIKPLVTQTQMPQYTGDPNQLQMLPNQNIIPQEAQNTYSHLSQIAQNKISTTQISEIGRTQITNPTSSQTAQNENWNTNMNVVNYSTVNQNVMEETQQQNPSNNLPTNHMSSNANNMLQQRQSAPEFTNRPTTSANILNGNNTVSHSMSQPFDQQTPRQHQSRFPEETRSESVIYQDPGMAGDHKSETKAYGLSQVALTDENEEGILKYGYPPQRLKVPKNNLIRQRS